MADSIFPKDGKLPTIFFCQQNLQIRYTLYDKLVVRPAICLSFVRSFKLKPSLSSRIMGLWGAT